MKGIQKQNKDWVIKVFGEDAFDSLRERCFRTMEEMAELCQAADFLEEDAIKVIRYVYSRPKGDPANEVGGAFLSFTALVERLGLDAGEELAKEMERVQKPEIIERCQKRFLEKSKDGVATGLVCNVCNNRIALGVASSAFGPVSLAYCRECLTQPADAMFVILYLYEACNGDINALNPAVKELKAYLDDKYVSVEEFFTYLKEHGKEDPRFKDFLEMPKEPDEPEMGNDEEEQYVDPVDLPDSDIDR